MSKQLEAVYEDGVLRALQPLTLADHQHVLLADSDEMTDYRAWAKTRLGKLGPPPGLTELHRRLIGSQGSLSDVVIEERGER